MPPRRIAWPSCMTERLRKALSVWLPGRATRRRAPLLTGGDASLFCCRVISPGRTTLASRLRGERRFGCRVESAGPQTQRNADTISRGLGYRVESASCQTRSYSQNNGNRFDYRVESVGRQTRLLLAVLVHAFDYRVESVGRQTDAGEPTDQMPDRTSEPDDKTSVFLFQRPKTGFPVRCGSPQALIPVPTTVQLALARRTYVTPSVAYAGNSNPLCHV